MIFNIIVVHMFPGIGLGIHYTGCMAVVNSYFDKYRAVATGTISIGT